jgi:hypothetical protein
MDEFRLSYVKIIPQKSIDNSAHRVGVLVVTEMYTYSFSFRVAASSRPWGETMQDNVQELVDD